MDVAYGMDVADSVNAKMYLLLLALYFHSFSA
jgi:hypothetical protein